MLDTLSAKFTNVFNKLRGYGKIREGNIEDALREVRLALLEADVNVAVVKSFLEKVKHRALGQEVLESLTPNQQFFKIVSEELVHVLGDKPLELKLSGKPPHVILLVGLQGSGKTTAAGKLACYYKKLGRTPYLVPADVYRPAAIHQLQTLAKKIDVLCYSTEEGDNPVQVAKEGVEEARDKYCDLVIIDTAGRLHIDDNLMDELKKIQKKLDNPSVLFVADAMTGQEAVKITKAFHDLLKIDGVFLTKLDGDARGGAVLSIQDVAGCPILFSGTGEKLEDIEVFDPERLISRLLDRGDILSLVEKAQEVVDQKEIGDLEKKFKKDQFTLEDFRTQLKQMKKLGSLKNLMGFLPGAKAIVKKVNLDNAEKELQKKEAIINSMTVQERLHPEVLNGSRRLRIANGSGTSVSDINRFLKEFSQIRKLMKNFSKGGIGSLKGMMGF